MSAISLDGASLTNENGGVAVTIGSGPPDPPSALTVTNPTTECLTLDWALSPFNGG